MDLQRRHHNFGHRLKRWQKISDFLYENGQSGKVPSSTKKRELKQMLCGEALPGTTPGPTTPNPTTVTTTTTEPTTSTVTTTLPPTQCPALAPTTCVNMDSYSPVCARLDITFVLDESSGISNDRWTKAKDFINWVVEKAASLNANNRYAVHRFSNTLNYYHGLRFGKSWEKYSFTNGGSVNKFMTCLKAEEYKNDVRNNDMKPTTTTNPQSIIFGTKLSSTNNGHQADIYEGLKKVKNNILDVARTQDLNTRQVIFLITQGNFQGGSKVGQQIANGLEMITNGLDRYGNKNQFIVVPTWAMNESQNRDLYMGNINWLRTLSAKNTNADFDGAFVDDWSYSSSAYHLTEKQQLTERLCPNAC